MGADKPAGKPGADKGAQAEVKDKKPPEQVAKAAANAYDPFIIQAVFPDAAAIFSASFQSLKEVKKTACVVMDTNALLIPYAINKEGLDRIRSAYKKLADEKRLVVPGQVAREFARNRIEKLKELHSQLTKRLQIVVPPSASPLFAGLAEYNELERIEGMLEKLFKEYRDQIAKLQDRVRGWQSDDPVSLMYREVFTGSVVFDPPMDKKEIQDDLLQRMTHQIPPGYKDAAKDDGGIGDVLIWHTILEVGRTRKTDVIFVSGEEKADWWHRADGRPLYPRYELVDEFRRHSNGKSFHILKFAELLEVFDADRQLVDAVRAEEQQASYSPGGIPQYRQAREAILKWLGETRPVEMIQYEKPEGVVRLVVGIEVAAPPAPRSFSGLGKNGEAANEESCQEEDRRPSRIVRAANAADRRGDVHAAARAARVRCGGRRAGARRAARRRAHAGVR